MDLKEDWFKALAIVVPVFATSLAISYDVGFFYGANIEFFTFFSLSEHVVFALQAIPFALLPSITLVGVIAGLWIGYHWLVKVGVETAAKVQLMGDEERKSFAEGLKKQVRRNKLIDPFVQAVIFGSALVFIFSRHDYAGGFVILVSQVINKLAYPVERWESKTFKYIMFAIFLSAGWATAFLIGYQRSEAILLSKSPSEKIVLQGNEDIQATIIRGGERGVLFKSFATGKLSFLRWDQIKRIDAF